MPAKHRLGDTRCRRRRNKNRARVRIVLQRACI
jgi:hypothetical protein